MNFLIKTLLLQLVIVLWASCASAQNPADLPVLMKQFQSEVANGQTEKAIASLEKIITLGEQMMGAANPDIIRMYGQKAVMLRNLSRYDEAEREANNMRRKAKRALGDNSPVYGAALNITGSIKRMKNDFSAAQEYYNQAVAVLEKSGAAGQKDLCETYVNLNDLFSETSQLAQAKVYGEKGYRLTAQLFGPNSPRTVYALNNFGMTLMRLGELDAAQQRLGESVKLHETVFGADHPEMVSAQNNMALLYVARGKYKEAEIAYEAASKLAKAKLPPSDRMHISLPNNYGQMLLEQGNHAQAEPLLQRAAKLGKESLGVDHPLTGLAMHNLGNLMTETKRFDQARILLTTAAKTLEDAHGVNHPKAIGSNSYLGSLSAIEGKYDEAIKFFDAVRRRANDAVWKDLPSLDTSAQQKMMGRTFNWTFFSSLSIAARDDVQQNVLQSTAEWLANGKGIAESALAAARMKPELRPKSLPWVSLDDVRSGIPADGVFVDIVRQDMIDFEGSSHEEHVLDPHYVAWIVPKKGAVDRVDLGDAAELDQTIDGVRKTIQDAGSEDGLITNRGEIEATDELNNKMAALSDSVWNPIAKLISDDVKRVIISPDGALWLVPWSAIPIQSADKNKPAEYLIEKYAVSTTLSGRALALDADPSQNSGLENKARSAVFSNPDFDQSPLEKQSSYQRLFRRSAMPALPGTRSAAFDSSRHKAAPLPGTEVESAAIIPRMKQWLGTESINSFKGREAMESVVKQLVRPKSVVFSTHGFFNVSESKSDSVDPLKRCGLLFAGCNDPASVIGGDDGVLTGDEITSIDFRNTELVVLSACETGIGLIEDGNGVAGLRRAFKLAGAKKIASTLWQIPDFDTAKLMGDFFDALADGEDGDDALRAAQIKRIKSRRKDNGAAHPFFWAGFSISGR